MLGGLQDLGLQERPEGHADPDGPGHGPDASRSRPPAQQAPPTQATPAPTSREVVASPEAFVEAPPPGGASRLTSLFVMDSPPLATRSRVSTS